MSVPITTILSVEKELNGYKQENVLILFKGKEYMILKKGPIEGGLNVFIKRGRGYYLLKTLVGKGLFKDMLKKVQGATLPPGYKQ